MNKVFFLICVIMFVSCDNESCAEEIISNSTDSDLYINFISPDVSFNNEVFIEKQSRKTIGQVECALGGVVVNYSIYDSVFIKNSSNQVLKVFKEDTAGKNIYNVDEYWSVSEPSKNHFVYTYEITDEDLE